jgi:UDP-4-amino-4-deoxy-L-arabinose formyltransferase/UDP-glucuronic acid dehydrogenase (UDP-4-keto-hexauronic acid decarboxylating)
MKAIVFAYHNIGCAGLESAIRHGYEVVAVFTHKNNPDENIWFRSVAKLAASHSIPVFTPEQVNHPLWIDRIRSLAPDIIFSFYYRNILKKSILKIPKNGCFNLHGSLLPKYRGRSPLNWALIHGEKEAGVTFHEMTAKVDKGGILGQKAFPIDSEDTTLDLFNKAQSATINLLDTILPELLKGPVSATPQNDDNASYFGGRKPEDGIIHWDHKAEQIRNLVRAVTDPYPGAFSYFGNQQVFIWQARVVPAFKVSVAGTVLGVSPLTVACDGGALEITTGQVEDGVPVSGAQLADELGLVTGSKFGDKPIRNKDGKKKILILGVNGFIGNHLSEHLLKTGDFEVYGMDINNHSLDRLMSHPDFHFFEGDISINREWIEYHVRKCDIILPLVAIATPLEYTRNPLRVFQLDFEENLRIIRYCVKFNKRIIFPSTSEVYGMCPDPEFDEDTSLLTLGPISKQRWIYSCSKQLLDRVLWAYGKQQNLQFTLFRPFNWIGPRLDSLESARIGSSRVITQLILNLVEGTPICLVDGGHQRRSFTDVSDGIEGLVRIIYNENNCCQSQIFNLGNPEHDFSITELAQILVDEFEKHPLRENFPPFAGMKTIEAKSYYGEGYQDIGHRKPRISKAKKILGWSPKVSMRDAVAETLDFFLKQALEKH